MAFFGSKRGARCMRLIPIGPLLGGYAIFRFVLALCCAGGSPRTGFVRG